MNDRKKFSNNVEDIVTQLKNNPSTRFSKTDFQILLYAVMSDPTFKAKKYVLRNDELVETFEDMSEGMKKFLDKFLKHVGLSKSSERDSIIESFEYGPRDVEWITDVIDEAMYLYTETGKSMKLFRDKMLQLGIRKMVRSGKYDGKVTYKKSVVDRVAALKKKQAVINEVKETTND